MTLTLGTSCIDMQLSAVLLWYFHYCLLYYYCEDTQISFYNKLDHISNTAMYNVDLHIYLNKDIAVILIKVWHVCQVLTLFPLHTVL